MRVLSRLRSWRRGLFHRAEVERGMTDELQFHIAQHAEHLAERHGLSPSDARRQARVAFGSIERYRDDARRSMGLAFVDEIRRDVRYAWRTAIAHKGFTAAVVAILALTIGANAAVYTFVDRLLVRPLPYPDSARLGTLMRQFARGDEQGASFNVSGSVWETMRDAVPDLDIAVVGTASGVNLATVSDISYVRQLRVSSGYFRVLGIPPALGREFTPEEDRSGGPSVVVISHALWQRSFGGDPNVVGQSITLRGEPSRVVGVMPDGFHATAPADVWTPLRPSPQGEGGGSNYVLIARVRPTATWSDAVRRVEAAGDVLIRERIHPPPDVKLSLHLVPLQRATTKAFRQPLLVLWAAVLVVLVIGCVNIAGLLLSRGSARAREIATRIAIGGGRGAIVRQLLVESLLLAACGTAAGTTLGVVLSHSLAAQITDVMVLPASPDLRVLLICTAAALGTSLLFGLFPALQTARARVSGVLGDAGGAAIAGRGNRWPMRVLVVSQVALGIVLVVAAGLLIRTFSHLARQQSGVDSTNVIAATMSLQDARYQTSAQVNALYDRSLEQIRELPGVVDAAVALSLPFERALNQGWRFDGEPSPRQDSITLTYVTPDYFRTLKIPSLRGRTFDAGDTSTSPPVMVVNDAFVRLYSAGADPIGRFVRLRGPDVPATQIVGVVRTIQQQTTSLNGQPIGAVPGAFVPAAQFGDGFVLAHNWFQPSWIARTHGPVAIVPALRRVLHDVDPGLAFNKFRTIDDVESESMAAPRTLAWLVGGLAGIALLLCLAGVYGLVANTVAARRRELGVRMALGATRFDTLKVAAAGGVGLALAGTAIGVLLSLPATRVMRQVVFGLSVDDPLTLVVAAGLVVLTACVAAILPAWRVLRMNVTAVLNSWQ